MQTQLTFTCSKSTIKTLEKSVFKNNSKNTRTTSDETASSASIVDFEQENVSWGLNILSAGQIYDLRSNIWSCDWVFDLQMGLVIIKSIIKVHVPTSRFTKAWSSSSDSSLKFELLMNNHFSL